MRDSALRSGHYSQTVQTTQTLQTAIPTGDSIWSELPEIEAVQVPLVNRLSQSLAPYPLELAKAYDVKMTTGRAPDDVFEIPLAIGESFATLSLPERILSGVLPTGHDLAAIRSLPPRHRYLLLEFRLLDIIERLEAELGETIEFGGSPGTVSAEESISLEFILTCTEDRTTVQAWLELPQSDAARLAGYFETKCKLLPLNAALLRAVVSIRAGWQILTMDEFAGLSVNDVVMLQHSVGHHWLAVQGLPAASVNDSGHGGYALASDLFAPVTQAPDSSLAGAEHLHYSEFSHAEFHYSELNHQPELIMEKQLSSNERLSSLEEVPVCLICEIGRVEMSLDEVRHLGEGSVVKLGDDRSEVVQLLINGQRVGRGELIKVGSGLGVRLTKLNTHE